MLPYKNRIRTKKEFDDVFKARKLFKKENIIFWYSFDATKTTSFAVVITTKFSKSAVVRNKFRRQIKEIIKDLLPYIKKKTQGVIVVSGKREKIEFTKTKETIINIFSNLHIIENKK